MAVPRATMYVALAALALCHMAITAKDQQLTDWIDPEASYGNGYEYISCPVTMDLRPSSTEQLAAEIKELYKDASSLGRIVKVRATHELFGSSASFPCAIQPKNSIFNYPPGKEPLVVGVLMDDMDKVLEVDPAAKTMTVQAQMNLGQLYAAATHVNMSVMTGVVPAWAGLTLAGIMAASAHGSGYQQQSVLCDSILEITWIDGKGDIHISKRDSEEGRGLCSGVGLLGIITELKLQMTDTTYMRIQTWLLRDDAGMVDDIDAMLEISPNLLVLWRPDLKKFTGYILTPVNAATASEDVKSKVNPWAECVVLPIVPAPLASLTSPSVASWQADINNEKLASKMVGDLACVVGLTGNVGQPWAADGLKPIYDGYGLANKVQSTDCGEDCGWTSKTFNHTVQDIEITIEKKDLAAWVEDVKLIIEKDLPSKAGLQRCLPPGFFVVRFGQNTDDYLATAHGMEEPIYVQGLTMRSKSAYGSPAKYEFIHETYEQLTLCKYKGRPHWGKNFDRTFTNPACKLRQKYPAFKKMLDLQTTYDPLKMFESELMTHVIKGTAAPLAPRCVMDRTCYCKEDGHCPVGHKCVPAKSFPEYLVCKPPGLV